MALLLTPWSLALASGAPPATEQRLDLVRSEVGFHLRTRWGQRIDGQLPLLEGERRVLADGRHQVRVVLDAARVQVEDSERLDAMARGEGFFDAERHPRIVFLSDPYPASLLQAGGEVHGWLQIRGERRPEVFVLEASSCSSPGIHCPVLARGSITRLDYGMDAFRLALAARVHFDLALWLQEPAP